ncbi:Tim10/DDP family zinc finger-domain-containing protein [Rostrohypoxylon terebratum]|nr:Tim10/DDP family zinc finger-domain-containing protein [Rostrohypoxylon terebratum]
MSDPSNFDVSKLSEGQKNNLQLFLDDEAQKVRIQNTIHSLTNICFSKCITGTIRSGKLDKSEEACMANCTDRFFDLRELTVLHLKKMRTPS